MLTKSIRVTKLTGNCFDAAADYPELHPDTTYGEEINCDIQVFTLEGEEPNTVSKSACYIRIGSFLLTPQQLQDVVNEANDFHDRLK